MAWAKISYIFGLRRLPPSIKDSPFDHIRDIICPSTNFTLETINMRSATADRFCCVYDTLTCRHNSDFRVTGPV